MPCDAREGSHQEALLCDGRPLTPRLQRWWGGEGRGEGGVTSGEQGLGASGL